MTLDEAKRNLRIHGRFGIKTDFMTKSFVVDLLLHGVDKDYHIGVSIPWEKVCEVDNFLTMSGLGPLPKEEK